MHGPTFFFGPFYECHGLLRFPGQRLSSLSSETAGMVCLSEYFEILETRECGHRIDQRFLSALVCFRAFAARYIEHSFSLANWYAVSCPPQQTKARLCTSMRMCLPLLRTIAAWLNVSLLTLKGASRRSTRSGRQAPQKRSAHGCTGHICQGPTCVS